MSETETILHDEFTITLPRVFLPSAMRIIRNAEETMCNRVVEYFEERNKERAKRETDFKPNFSGDSMQSLT